MPMFVPVHPRVCGERSAAFAVLALADGSSPRVRGTPQEDMLPTCCSRFIPACAGNATYRHTTRHQCPVHPRVCGERWARAIAWFNSSGSSPRVRGTRSRRRSWHNDPRFIPACAGNASPASVVTGFAAVHPRVCGERGCSGCSGCSDCGSSPRVRGTPCWRSLMRCISRFIPACAGNATALRALAMRLAVHPRVCGEREIFAGLNCRFDGSSPRVRGTRRSPSRSSSNIRFIPACAGNATSAA